MKRYDLKQIMRAAHRTYKYVGKKQGKTFAEVLKSTWRLEKMSRSIEDTLRQEEEKRIAAKYVKVESTRADYMGYISDIALYGSSYANGGHFVND